MHSGREGFVQERCLLNRVSSNMDNNYSSCKHYRIVGCSNVWCKFADFEALCFFQVYMQTQMVMHVYMYIICFNCYLCTLTTHIFVVDL